MRAEARAGFTPLDSAEASGSSDPAVVARSWPSTQISTPAGSVTKNALARLRVSSTSSVSVLRGAMPRLRVSVA
jgi:hypothetical protein